MNKNVVIIEGPDGAGKTTLIEQIRDNATCPWTIIMRTSGPTEKLQQLYDFHSVVADASYKAPVVCDRYPAISEYVYGRAYDRPWKVSDSVLTSIANTLPMIVYCRPPMTTLERSVKSELQMEGVHERLEWIVELYDNLFNLLNEKCPWTRVAVYDFTDPNPHVIAAIREQLYGE